MSQVSTPESSATTKALRNLLIIGHLNDDPKRRHQGVMIQSTVAPWSWSPPKQVIEEAVRYIEFEERMGIPYPCYRANGIEG